MIDENRFIMMEEEVEDNPELETLEENLSVEDMELSNLDLVRVDMNVIEYPLFSKNNHRKKNQSVKYFFNNDRDRYIKISPIVGDYIPGELEEKVFIVLLKIVKRKGFPSTFYVSSSEIISELGNINKAYYDRVKKALLRLSRTHYDFKNTLYLNKINQTVNQLISTNILNLEIIELARDKNLQKEYNDSRIKEVYKISISDHFYENIIRKGYLVYDAKTLLELDGSISRSLYMLLTKLRYEKLHLQLPILYLIKRIPLKYEEKNLYRTVKTLESACVELVKKQLIQSFNLVKNKNWKDAEIEFFFSQEHNQIKQLNFFDDKNYFANIINGNDQNQLMISYTEESETLLDKIKKEHQEKHITDEDVERIMKILPEKASKLKTLPKFLKISAQTHGLEHLMKVAEYVKNQKPRSVLGYFSKALEQNWAADYIATTEKEKLV
ncbi:MAG: replication initiator protein A [Fusobacteriaceae bacterium]